MSINWGQIGSVIGGIASALSNAGVSAANIPTVLSQIGALTNPNESAELAICQQILLFSGNPTLLSQLEVKLATEQGIPASAAALALTLSQPNVDIPTRVLQIEQIIKSGS